MGEVSHKRIVNFSIRKVVRLYRPTDNGLSDTLEVTKWQLLPHLQD
jgi:hypothetical protein